VRLFHRGDRGEPVRDIQGRLRALGHDCAPDEDGVFGPETEQAVARFQRTRSLAPDGIVGSDTWRALVESGYRLGDRMLYHRVPMMRGDDVATLQGRLNALGFDSGKTDGIFGPETLEALLDFQRNRTMAEDGIAGVVVAIELGLMQRATGKPGREGVREREWLRTLPGTIARQRVYIDAFCRNEKEAEATWRAAVGFASAIQLHGAQTLLSRSADTAPPERLRARRANRLDAQVVVSFVLAANGDEAVFFFSSEHSTSAAGEMISAALAERLGLPTAGRAIPILRETRAPCVVISASGPNDALGREAAEALADFYERGVSDPEAKS